MASFILQFVCGIITAFLLAIFINYPPPEFSEEVRKWESKGKYFAFGDHTIFFRDDQGIGKSGDLLLIHGFPTSSYDWKKIWKKLRKRFNRVIAPDMLGFGLSDKPMNHTYTVKEQALMHEQLLAYLGVEQVHILAHDLGDTVSQEMLARHEALQSKIKIRSLCLTNGGIFPETHHPRPMQKLLLNKYLAPVLSRLSCFPLFMFSFSAVFGVNTRPSTEELKDFWALIRHKDGQLIMPRLLEYLNERRKYRERWVGVLEVTLYVPVHFIYGASDPVNPPAILDRFREIAPNIGITELDPQIGHYPQIEDPKGLVSAYYNFIKSVRTKQSVG